MKTVRASIMFASDFMSRVRAQSNMPVWERRRVLEVTSLLVVSNNQSIKWAKKALSVQFFTPSVTTIFQSNFGGADISNAGYRSLSDQMSSLIPPWYILAEINVLVLMPMRLHSPSSCSEESYCSRQAELWAVAVLWAGLGVMSSIQWFGTRTGTGIDHSTVIKLEGYVIIPYSSIASELS